MKDDCADFGCIWIQYNGVITHVKIKGCCKSETFKLMQYNAYFLDWKRISKNYPLIDFPKIAKKAYSVIFCWYYKRWQCPF